MVCCAVGDMRYGAVFFSLRLCQRETYVPARGLLMLSVSEVWSLVGGSCVPIKTPMDVLAEQNDSKHACAQAHYHMYSNQIENSKSTLYMFHEIY